MTRCIAQSRHSMSGRQFYMTVSRRWFFYGSILLFMFRVCLVFLSVYCSLVVTAGNGLTSWLSCIWCFIVFLSLSNVVSWVKCGAWLYRFLIFAFFLTLIWDRSDYHNLNLINWTTFCMLGFACFLSYANCFIKYHQSFKQFGSISSPTFWSRAWSGSKLFAKENSKRQCYHKQVNRLIGIIY